MLTKAVGVGTGSKTSRLLPVQRQPEPYVRPADWSALPTVNSGDQKLVGLVAIYPGDSNNVSVICSAAYTVDWGDGSAAANFGASVPASKNITFASVSSGTLTSGGYRQAIVTITPQAGQNLTIINLNQQGSTAGATTLWLDIKVAGANIATLTMSGSTGSARLLQQFEFVGPSNIVGTAPSLSTARSLRKVIGTVWTANATTLVNCFVNCSMLQEIPLLDTHSCTTFSSTFSGCRSLVAVPKLDTSAATTFSTTFQSCSSLQAVPLFNTALVTTFSSTFSGCTSLREVPLFNTALGTNFSTMFGTCTSLREIPKFNTVLGTNFSSMFQGCNSLQTIPLLNTAAGTNFSSMFLQCTSLQTIPLINTGLGTDFTSMFDQCSSLQSVPLLDTSHGVTFTSMFSGCAVLPTIPLLDTHLGTAMSSMFTNCTNLQTIPLIDTSANLTFASFFSGCSGLQAIPLLVATAATTFTSCFTTCSSLQVAAMTGLSKTVNMSNMKLSAAQLDAVYTALASGVTAQTITVSGNPGTAGDTPSIATAKGWTVTGS